MSAPDPSKSCPICGAAAVAPYQPFCSRRCADVDLHRWLGGVYRVETDDPAEENVASDSFLPPRA